jgi:gliding motility-associated-like protein
MMASQTYFVTVASSFGCKATDSVTIDVFCDESQIFIPNSFTPNGDGQNDVFYPRGSGISTVKAFRIYNRWGELVFEKTNFDINDASAAWDGTYKGGSARTDVFVYLLEATCTTGKPLFYKGDVTIIK